MDTQLYNFKADTIHCYCVTHHYHVLSVYLKRVFPSFPGSAININKSISNVNVSILF